MLKGNIYYADEEMLKRVNSDFDLVERKNWYVLYHNKVDKSFWRLDESDKYEIQLFVKLDAVEDWETYDDLELRLKLLKEHRGLSNEKCRWKDCNNRALNNLVFCQFHAYTEMGIRQ